MTERESHVPPDPSGIEEPHDVLAAEPSGIQEPHDVLAAEEFAMPAPEKPGGPDAASRAAGSRALLGLLLVAAIALVVLRRRL
jgi:hypothetical protein